MECLKSGKGSDWLKYNDFRQVELLDTPLVEMSVLSINSWLTKFVHEVAKPSRERYPPKTLYGIITGIRRFLAEQKPSKDINPLNTSDKRFDLTDDFKHIVFKLHSQNCKESNLYLFCSVGFGYSVIAFWD